MLCAIPVFLNESYAFSWSLGEARIEKRGHQGTYRSKDDTGMAKFLDMSEAELQGKKVIVTSRDDSGGAEFQGSGVLSVSKTTKLGRFVISRAGCFPAAGSKLVLCVVAILISVRSQAASPSGAKLVNLRIDQSLV